MSADVEDLYPLTPMQEGMLFDALHAPTHRLYVQQLVCRVRGPLDRDAFRAAWRSVVARHPALRTAFVWEDADKPLQVVLRSVEIPFEERDLRATPAAEQEEALATFLKGDRARGFDLRDAPLLRLALLRVSDDEVKVVWTHHHLILDGWSLPIVLGDVFRVYAAMVTGSPLALPDPPPFRALLGWLREQRAKQAEALASAKRALEGFTRPTPLPLEDGPRGPLGGPAEAHGEVTSAWTPETTARLEARARSERVTLASLLDAAWALVLARHAGTDDVVFGVTVAGRPPLLRGAATTVGNFIGTIPLRVHVAADATVSSLASAVLRSLGDHASHAHLSLAELKAASDVPKHAPLFESVVVVESYPVDPSLAAGVAGIVVFDVTTRERTSTPLTLVAAPGTAGLRLGLLHDRARFSQPAAKEILARYEHVLRSLAEGHDGTLADAALSPVAPPSVPAEVIAVDTTLDAWFTRTARTHAARIAVKEAATGATLTYAGLFRRAAGLAHALLRAGVGPGERVGVCVDRSNDLVASVLGVLLAGAAYVPIDVSVPAARIRYVIEDASLRVLVTRAADDPRGRGEPLPDLVVVVVTGEEDADDAPHVARRSPADLAYVIYTSGSTGKPKGTLVSHANVVRLFVGTERWLRAGPDDVWTLLHSIAFDFSVWELFGALLYGGTLLVVPLETARRPSELHALVAEERVTVLNQTPSAFEAFDAADADAPRALALRTVIFGGEALRVARLGPWFERHGEASPQLVNMFGITETTVHVTVRPLRRDDVGLARPGESVIGVPLPDLAVEVRDARGLRVPDGVAGELWVGGAGVTRGYLERPALTAARFEGGWYRTGDRGRRRLDGELVHLGRLDDQLKVRGFRIEPAEIEAVLEAHPSVRACAVVAEEPGEGGDGASRSRLVAFVVLEPGAAEDDAALRAFAASKLLRAMVPSAFARIDALPLSVNGKVDRAKLARMRRSEPAREVRPRPSRGGLVDLVASVWAELLGLASLDPDADVFEHGAHSLLATRAASRLARATERDVPIRLLFEHPTPARLARALTASAEAMGVAPVVPAVSQRGLYPTSLAQRRLWFLDRLEGSRAFYTIPAALRVSGALDEVRLAAAWERVVDRHAALRATFVEDEGEPRQRTTGPRAPLRIVRVASEDAALAAARSLAGASFDLAAGPLARAEVLRWSDEDALFVLAIHHIVADGWSLGILVRDLARAYGGVALEPLAVDQPDYAAWQRARPAFDEGLRFFREALAGAPALLELPRDRARPARATHDGAEIPFALTLEETRALEAQSRAASATLFMTLLAGLEVFLARVSGQDDVSVGVSVAGRTLPETEEMVGFFVNLVVVRARIGDDATVAEALRGARRRTLEAFVHADVPFEQVVEAIHPRRSLGDAPLFQVNFVYQNLPRHRIESGGLALEPVLLPSTSSRFDLVLAIDEPAGGALRGTLTFRTDLFDRTTAERFIAQYRAVLAAIAASDQTRVGAIRLGPAALPAATPLPALPLLLHERVAARAREAPDRIAVVHGDVTVTYGELSARVRRLAGELRRIGVRRGSRVAIALPPRVARVVSVLATLEAGASFVPLDPAEPLARREAMLASSGASVVLADAETEGDLPAGTASVVVVDDACAFTARGDEPVTVGVAPEDEAYVIFTSGSTGTPKGVALGHAGLANLADAQIEAFGVVSEDRVLAFASFAFDASVSELAMALGSGATLDLGEARALRRVDVGAVLRSRAITVVTLPPSLLRVTEPDAEALRVLVAAGEPLTDDVARRWQRGGRRVFNAYGPTETTVCATIHELAAGDPGAALRPDRVPIGRAMRGLTVLVLDEDGEAVPVGVAGEIFVAGVGVAHGYLDDERTHASFVERARLRGYRTGDRARWRPDGTLEFLGRRDAQVKLRGHRIELGEVETVLAARPGVVEVAARVVALAGEGGDAALVAYVVAPEDAPRPSPAELRSWVAERLPEVMVPARFAFVAALPRTTSGKLDRASLPWPLTATEEPADGGPEAAAPPEGPIESTIAAIWSSLLGVGRIGRASDFFGLGGHSLLAAQVTARVRDALDVDAPLALLFTAPLLSAYAEAVARLAGRSLARPTRLEDRAGPLLPSYAQERLWLLDQLEPGSTAYTLASAFRLRGPLDRDGLSRAMDAVVARHEVLRARFVTGAAESGGPRIVVDPPSAFVPLLAITTGDPETVAADLVREPFDLARGPLLRARLVVLGAEDHVLVVAVHHAVCDARSLDVLVRDLASAHRGEALPPLAIGYLDWAAFERRSTDASRVAFWARELDGAPEALALGGRRARRESARAGRIEASLPRGPVEAAALRGRVTPFMFLLASYALLLARRAGAREVVIGAPVTARPHPDTEELVGLLANTVALRIRVGEATTMGELLATVRASCLRAYAHTDVPFERVVEATRAPRRLGQNPVFQALFTLQDAPRRAEGVVAQEGFGGLVVEPITSAPMDAKVDLSVAVAPRGEDFAIWLEHRVDVLDESAARRLLAQLTTLASRMTEADAEARLADLDVRSPDEAHLLASWAGAAEPELLGRTFLADVLDRARERPDAVAVEAHDGARTYAELVARAQAIGAAVLARGGRGAHVAVAMSRGVTLVEALLGVMLAGAAYVPITRDAPRARVEAAFALAEPALVVTTASDRAWAPRLPSADETLVVDALGASGDDVALPDPGATAYVLFTSGSTGEPKGVPVSHASLANLLLSLSRDVAVVPDDVVLALTPLSFDIAGFELWAPLVRGACVRLTGEDDVRDPAALARLLDGVSLLQTTPSTWRLLLDAGLGSALAGVRKIAGGEALPPSLAADLLALGGPLWNVYGPTETTIWSTIHRVAPEDVDAAGYVPIGRPLANTRVTVVDNVGQAVAIGVPGELHLGGAGVARGYLGGRDASLFAGGTYRTGDRVRFRDDGVLVWLGREDHQVKIRGHRLELGEVETAIERCPGVRACAAVVRGDMLVAFVVGDLPARETLRPWLSEAAMPAHLVAVDALPRTPNGKIDRLALAGLPLGGASDAASPPERALSPEEAAIARIWGDVLGREITRPGASFFELGGHSLLAVQVVARIRAELARDVPLRALFAAPTLEAFAREVSLAHRGGLSPLTRAAGEARASRRATFAEERMWLLAQVDPEDAAYHIPVAFRLRGAADATAFARDLERAIAAAVVRQSALRTTFVWTGAHLEARIAERAPIAVARDVVPSTGVPAWLSDNARRLFDLERGPLFRVRLAEVSAGELVLLVVLHHLVADAWSVRRLVGEIAASLRGDVLPTLSVELADVVRWQRESLAPLFDAQLAFWTRALEGAEPLSLPTDLPRRSGVPRGARITRSLPSRVTAPLLQLAREEGTTPFVAFLAAWTAVLARYAGREEVTVGVPVAGRRDVALEPLVGLFVNTVAMRTSLAGDPDVRALVRRVRETALAAMAHEDVPFAEVVRAVAPARDPSRTPLFEAMFLLNARAEAAPRALAGLTLERVEVDTGAAAFDVTLAVTEGEAGAWEATLEWRADLFTRETAERLLGAFVAFGEAAGEADARALGVSLGPASVIAPSADGSDAPPGRLVLGGAPDAIAIVAHDGLSWTRRELEDRASRVATVLRGQGVRQGTRVALSLERGADAVASILGIWRAGAAYVPLDPAWPEARRATLRELAGAHVVVDARGVGVVAWDDLARAAPSELEGPAPDDVAYVLFTSGSTGAPKGVVVTHRSVANLAWAMSREMRLAPGDRVLQFASLAFDASVEELATALVTGATLVVRAPGAPGSVFAFLDEVERQGVTVLDLPTAFFHAWMDEAPGRIPASVRLVVIGGEAASHAKVARFHEAARAAGVTLLETYGPTEATVTATCFRLGPSDALPARVPIGRPIAGVGASVLDRAGRPVPVGAPGELALHGAGVARGYLDAPEATLARFVDGGRTYLTGDRARLGHDGQLEFLGRLDRQVKLRGHRVEPGEIEAVLSAAAGVREAVVDVRSDRLVAWVALEGGDASSPATLAAHARRHLPEVMVPAIVVVAESFPKTTAGKVDRARLPDPEVHQRVRIAPRSAVEASLAAMYAALLGVAEPSMDDDFFALGGHSLLATQLLSRIRAEHGRDLPVRALFDAPTIEGLAAALAASPAGGERGVPRRRDLAHFPLSHAQERLYFLDRLAPGDPFYVLPSSLELRGPVDVEALRRAFEHVIARHEVLRATFVDEGGVPVQRVSPPGRFELPVRQATRDEALALALEDARTAFDLARGPLVRAELVTMDERHHVLVASMHHIVSDGWSTGVLLRELGSAYAAYARGEAPRLPPLPIQYADYAAFQRASLGGAAEAEQVAYFRRALAGAPPLLALPTDRPRPPVQSFAGRDLHVAWPASLAEGVRARAHAQGATPFMVLLAAFQATLARISGETDIVIGASMAGRDRVELEPLVGFFVNIVVLRGDFHDDPSFAALVDRTRAQAVSAFAHRDLPFDVLVDALGVSRTLAHAPVFQVNFVLQNAPDAALALPGVDVRPLATSAGSARFDLALSMTEGRDGIGATFTYRTDLFDAETIERMARQLRRLLAAALADPERRLSTIPLDEGDVPARVEDRDDRTSSSPVHVTFAELAASHPERVALRHGDARVTYAELDRAANRLAHHLRASGVRVGARVAIATERTPARIIAVLAAWKAGAAYVPVDLANPLARIGAMLEDAAVDVAIADASGEEALPSSLTRVVALEAEAAAIGRCPGTPPYLADVAEAYVLFTSGSTGRPKGVSVTHLGVANLARAQRAAFMLGPDDVVLHFASFGFDASVSEIMTALTSGASLDLGDGAAWAEGDALERLLARRRITCLTAPPSLLRELSPELVPELRVVVSAGEACDPLAVRPWLDAGRLVLNAYGPTEATVCATIHRVTSADRDVVPIGQAMDGVTVEVRGPHGEVAPRGAFGLLAIGGVGVARGYVGRAAEDPSETSRFADEPGGRVFLTGDRVRLRGDGVLVFAGRADDQVKVRGFRVEPGEVEAALLTHPAVVDAAVVVRALGARDVLVAFVVADDPSFDAGSHLAARVPPYMVPARVIVCETLPKTSAGKTDRAALRQAPIQEDEGGASGEEPRTEAERVLARIWRQVLGVAHVGPRDNFFALGGDSIASLQIVAAAARDGLAVTPKLLFEHQTLAALAAHASPSRSEEVGSARGAGDRHPLTPVQEGMLFHALYDPASAVYVSQLRCRIRGPIDVPRFEAAWRHVMERHTALRTSVSWEGRVRAEQMVHEAVALPLRVERATDAASLDALAAAERSRGFDLREAPLFRLVLVRLGDDEHELVWTHHHLVLDGWSVVTVLDEVLHVARSDAPLAPARPYRDYVDWLARVDRSGDDAYWTSALARIDHATPLPIGVPKGRAVRRTRELVRRVSREDTRALVAALRASSITASTLVTAAWAELLGRLVGTDDVLVGVTVAGRPAALAFGGPIVGLFVNTLPLVVQRTPDEAAGAWLERVQSAALAMREREHASLPEVARLSRVPRGEPLFESIVVFENFPAPASASGAGASATVITAVSGAEQTSYPLTLVAAPGEELELRLAFDEDRFDAGEVRALLEHLALLVVSLSVGLDRPVREADHLGAAARGALLVAGTGPPAAPRDGAETVPSRIAAAAARAPSAVAIVDGPRALTYRDLEGRADRLAGELQRVGIGPGARVAVLLERSAELVIAFLAVWRAGAVVVPLDPSHPPLRRDYCMQDARVAAIVARREAASSVPTVLVDAPATRSGARGVGPRPHDDAYVLYTSGSTGRPKGVVVPHAALAGYVAWARDAYGAGVGEGTAAALHTSPAFDLTLTSLLLPLVAGGRVDVVAEGPGTEALAARLGRGPRLGLLKLTPSHLAHLLATLEDAPPAHGLADVVVLGGEALSGELVEAVLRVDPRARVWNEYGPTEACIGCVAREVTPEDAAIGHPIPGTRAHVLDGDMAPAPLGVAGDLWVGGDCLARGYLGRPDDTARAFVETPYGRLYRTGDRARLRPDGVLAYLGRADDQVKVRGHRVELGEVEHALAGQPEVREAAAAIVLGRLVAWVVLHAAGIALAGGDLRARVREALPDAFVPSEVIVVERLPLAPSGKVDRGALVASLAEPPRADAGARGDLPVTETERTLATIWERVLGRSPVLRDDDFFASGGDSILALQVVALARQASLVVTPRLVFEGRTLASVAAHAMRRPEVSSSGGPRVEGTAPVTPVMEWFFARSTRRPAHYNQSVLFAVREGAFDVNAFEEAFLATLAHHGLTRTRFAREASGWTLRQGGAPWRPLFRVVDLSPIACVDAVGMRVEELADETQRSLSLEHGDERLAAVLVVLLGAGRGVRVQIVIHHLVVDAVSWTPLLGDLATATLQRARGVDVALAPVPATMLDWAEALDRRAADPALKDEVPFWRDVVAPGAGRLPRHRRALEGGDPERTNARARVLRLHADAAALGDAAARLGCRLHELVLAALGHVLCAWAGHDAVVVDVEGHGREAEALDVPLDLSRAAGWFTVLHPLRLRARHATLAEDVAAVRDACRVIPSAGLGYGLLRWRVRDEALVGAPPAEVSFNFLGRAPGETFGEDALFGAAPEARGDEEGPDEVRTHALEVTGKVSGTTLGLEWAYDPAELGEDAVREAARRLEATLAAMTRLEAVPVGTPRRVDPLVLPLAMAGANPPLFLVHPVGGAASCYAELARALGDRAVHGIEAVGLHDGRGPLDSVEAMAARYVEAVRQVQPSGPWLVGGWSMGALVATEIARLLALGGERADVVAIDQLPSEVEREITDESVLSRIAESVLGASRAPAPPGATPEEQLRALLAAARASGAEVDEALARRLVRLVRAGFRALGRFRPRPFPGRVLVLRARDAVERASTEAELAERAAAAAAEWAPLARGGVTVRVVPGHHLSVLDGAHAGETARALREGLEVV